MSDGDANLTEETYEDHVNSIAEELFDFDWFKEKTVSEDERVNLCKAAAIGMLWAVDCSFVSMSEEGLDVAFFEWPLDQGFGPDTETWDQFADSLISTYEREERRAIAAKLRSLADAIDPDVPGHD
jgi:hypothetical protein